MEDEEALVEVAQLGRADAGRLGQARTHRVLVGAEQGRGGQDGGRDRNALGDRLGRVADRVEVGEDLRALAVDIAGHLGDALGVVGDRAEGVHRNDDANGGEQAAPGERDEEERDRERAAAEEEGEVDGQPDDRRGVDRGLQADADAGEDHSRRAGQRGAGDVAGGPGMGAGEVAGEPEDDAGEDDADDDRGDRDEARLPPTAAISGPTPSSLAKVSGR